MYRKSRLENSYQYHPYCLYNPRHVIGTGSKKKCTCCSHTRFMTRERNIWFGSLLMISVVNSWSFRCCVVNYPVSWRAGYPARALDATIRKVSWNRDQRRKLLKPKMNTKPDISTCCTTDAPGISLLKKRMDLTLQKLPKDTDGSDIFPPLAYFALRSTLILVLILCYSSHGIARYHLRAWGDCMTPLLSLSQYSDYQFIQTNLP